MSSQLRHPTSRSSSHGHQAKAGLARALPLTCLESASSRSRSRRGAARRSPQGRWCWRPGAAARAGRGTGQGSAWPASRSAGARAAAGAGSPVGGDKGKRCGVQAQVPVLGDSVGCSLTCTAPSMRCLTCVSHLTPPASRTTGSPGIGTYLLLRSF